MSFTGSVLFQSAGNDPAMKVNVLQPASVQLCKIVTRFTLIVLYRKKETYQFMFKLMLSFMSLVWLVFFFSYTNIATGVSHLQWGATSLTLLTSSYHQIGNACDECRVWPGFLSPTSLYCAFQGEKLTCGGRLEHANRKINLL